MSERDSVDREGMGREFSSASSVTARSPGVADIDAAQSGAMASGELDYLGEASKDRSDDRTLRRWDPPPRLAKENGGGSGRGP